MTRSRRRTWSFRLVAVLLGGAVMVPLLEVILRLEYALRQRHRPSLAFVSSDDLGWLPTPDLETTFTKTGYGEIPYRTDELGFRRFDDPDGAGTRLWAVGDSTTQAYQVPAGRAYYDVLAELDPTLRVFGYGVGGYGTVQEALALERFWPRIRPHVVLWQMCANDFVNNDWRLEAASNEHNNHMARPYLGVDDRIELRHPDGRLGWLAHRSLVARRLAVLRSSLRKRSRGSIEPGLSLEDPRLRRSVEATRRAIRRIIESAPETAFLAFFVPGREGHRWEEEAWRQVCELAELECLPEVHRAVEAARRAGETVDGGADPHWNARGHRIAARVIHERLAAHRATLREAGS